MRGGSSINGVETERLLKWQASPVGTLPMSIRTLGSTLVLVRGDFSPLSPGLTLVGPG